jgi:LacI family transcriptional regulator
VKQPPRVALIIETTSSYGSRIVSGIAKYLRSHHRWSVFLEQHELGTRPPSWMFSGRWDGILSRPTDPDLAAAFRKMQVPTVDLNDQHDHLKLPWVGSNHSAIGRLGAAHLLERGYRHFAFAGFTAEPWAAKRREGFREIITAQGYPLHLYESPWRGPDAPKWDKDLHEIEHWLKQLPQPLAIMACNDVRGLHVLDACARLGLAVPEQVAVLGVDNDPSLCELCMPPLSSVEPNPEAIGYAAAELLDHLMAGKGASPTTRIVVDPVRVVTRRSTDSLAIEDHVVATALRYIREQAVFGCSVDEVRKHIRVSRSVLERRFRQHLKCSPMAEIRAVQLGRVKQLLAETDFTLERIAELSGFKHPEYLSVAFKKFCGKTPGSYRKQHRR